LGHDGRRDAPPPASISDVPAQLAQTPSDGDRQCSRCSAGPHDLAFSYVNVN
jgi:hypothetical protein